MGILPVFFTVSGPLLQETPRASMPHIAAAEVLKRTPPGEVRDNLVTICNDRKLALCTLEGGPGCGKSQFVIQLLQELTKHPETDRLHFFTFPTRVLRDQMIARLRSEGVQFLPRGKGPNDEDLFFEAVGEQYELQFPGAASAPSKVLPIFVFFKVALSLCPLHAV